MVAANDDPLCFKKWKHLRLVFFVTQTYNLYLILKKYLKTAESSLKELKKNKEIAGVNFEQSLQQLETKISEYLKNVLGESKKWKEGLSDGQQATIGLGNKILEAINEAPNDETINNDNDDMDSDVEAYIREIEELKEKVEFQKKNFMKAKRMTRKLKQIV